MEIHSRTGTVTLKSLIREENLPISIPNGVVDLSTALAKHHANGDTSMVTETVNLCPIM